MTTGRSGLEEIRLLERAGGVAVSWVAEHQQVILLGWSRHGSSWEYLSPGAATDVELAPIKAPGHHSNIIVANAAAAVAAFDQRCSLTMMPAGRTATWLALPVGMNGHPACRRALSVTADGALP